MATLGMTLADSATPITKDKFKRWHSEGSLLLLDAGIGVLDIVLSRLNDTSIDYRPQGRPVTRESVDGVDNRIIMFSNGVETFIIVVGEMESDSNRNHLTIYVTKG